MENLPEAFKLLVVGMLTVFCILLIVIYFGKLLIALVNKYAPEEVAKPAKAALKSTPSAAVDQQTMSIIQAAVSQLTGGKGKVSKVEKVN
ncbi:MAG: OadG family protein [Bacteroidaceae bacterium]|jgi:oxaloacetate decarboxylase gamma subunit|nr:OadG family protein [Bacteroidaceae bacterium]